MQTDTRITRIVQRRHPEYGVLRPHWDFLYDTYIGGRQWFGENIFKYHKEGDVEFGDRQKRAYRFNHTREVVDLVVKYLLKAKINRSEDASEAVKAFWQSTSGGTNGQQSIDQFVRDVATRSAIYGRLYVVVDATDPASESVVSVADERRTESRIYAYTVGPQRALDMSFDPFGELNWILFQEDFRDDEDPFASSEDGVPVRPRYRLWTRDTWHLLTPRVDDATIFDEKSGVHGLGVVPVVIVDHVTCDESLYSAPSMIGDVAYLDRAVANYLSNLDAIIQDQTFSQLVIPAQSLPVAIDGTYSDAARSMIEMGTKRIFTYDASNGAPPPGYISPDVKQAELILAVVSKIINEIYHSVGVAGERTKQDNSMGIDNSSGVAKAYDFDRVNSLLSAKAAAMEQAENSIAALVDLWAGVTGKTKAVRYPTDFDVRGLADEFDVARKLLDVGAPDEVRRMQMEQLIDKLFPNITDAVKQKMVSAMADWPIDVVVNQEMPKAPDAVNPAPSDKALPE